MMEAAGLNHSGMIEVLPEFEHKLSTVMPAILRPAEDAFSIQRIQVDRVKTAFIKHLCLTFCDLRQKGGIGIGNEVSVGLLQMMNLGALGVG